MFGLSRHYVRECSRAFKERTNYRFMAKITGSLGAVEPKQNRVEFVTEDIMNDSMGSRTIPLIDSTLGKVSPKIYQDTDETSIPSAELDRSPRPFEDIPGPAVLKIWEKYWKYVPILGTQLVCSLLVNNFTHGKLTFSRSFVPLKYLFNEYGPIVRINGPMIGDVVMIHRPDHVAQVLRQEGENPSRSSIDVLQHYRLDHRKYRLPGPFSMQGKEWLETRSKLAKLFNEQIWKRISRLDGICDEFAQRIRGIRDRQDEVPEDFDKELSRWGMECFSVLMFDRRLGFFDQLAGYSSSEVSTIIEALRTAHLYMSKCETGFQVWRFFETPYFRKMSEACDVIDNLINKYIREAQSQLGLKSSMSEENSDTLADENSSILESLLKNQQMHPDDVSALLMDSIILGVQATVNSQAFLLYFLAKNPRVQRKLYEEVSAGARRSLEGSPWTEKNLAEMTYLKACVRECLRLRPPFPCLSRILQKSISLHGYTIPKGTYLIMANEISSHREENFEDPDKFVPERWLSVDSEGDIWQKFSCLPFGHGPRSCLGRHMAETKIMLLTSKLIREFRIEYDYAKIGSKYLTISAPNRPLRFRFVDRRENWRASALGASAL